MVQMLRLVGEIAVVTAAGDFHPLRQLSGLAKDLARLNFQGVVLFDLLAVNGLAPNRFVSINFVDGFFDRSSFAIASGLGEEILDEQNCMIREDSTFLVGSVLSSSEVLALTSC